MPPPLLFVRPEVVTQVRQQIAGPPDPKKLPWNPLPKVDAEAAARVVDDMEKKKQAAVSSSDLSGPVRSAFSSQSTVTGGLAGLFAGREAGSTGGAPAPTPKFGAPDTPKPAGGGARTGNQALADAIARKLQQRGQ
ncbi:MAG: hypothetical protein AMXMBFR33_05310 [Candidatus Xenobia bacterium]